MSGAFPLADGFDPVAHGAWREKALGDRDRPLSTVVDDGLEVAWLYVPADELAPDPGGAPGSAPFVRGARVGAGWDIRQEHAAGDRAAAHDAILDDLVGGATSIGLRLDRAARGGWAPGSEEFAAGRGRDGIAISTVDDLDLVLDGVYLDLAPIALDAGPLALPAAALLVALWERRGHDLAEIGGSLRHDPIGVLAAEGGPPWAAARAAAASPAGATGAATSAADVFASAAAAVATAGELAAECASLLPRVRPLAVGTSPYAEAGATAATELAVAIATATAYLRACEAAGLPPAEAAPRIELTLASGPDQFLEIAKLRAARRLWARVLEASGVAPDGRRSPIYSRTARRMLAAVDPWVNMLRGTTAAFAAAVGAADGITVDPFDTEIADVPGPLGRRVARNTQLVLQEEAQLARVADPAGGSWYVESLTDDLARAAWEELRAIERGGGILAALRDGALAARLAGQRERREAELARRARRLTGVNTFPLLGDDGVEIAAPADTDALARLDAARAAERPAAPDLDTLRTAPPSGRLRAAADLAARGARIDELAAALGAKPTAPATAPPALPLPRNRDAAPFETLRDRAAAMAVPPRVYLSCLGPLSAHVTTATWAKSFFEVGGIEAVPSGAHPDLDALAAAFAADGAAVTAICAGPKATDADLAAAVAKLRGAGAREVLLASETPERAGAASADAAVADGIDMIAFLGGLLDRIGAAR